MTLAETAAAAPGPSPFPDGCFNLLPEPAQHAIERALGYQDDPLTFLQSPKENEEMTRRGIAVLKSNYGPPNGAQDFFRLVFEPEIENLATDHMPQVMLEKAKKLVNYWTSGDTAELRNEKLTNLFYQFSVYPLGHPSFSDGPTTTLHPDRIKGLKANDLFSHIFAPQQFYEGMNNIFHQEETVSRNGYEQLANIASAYALNLERTSAEGGTLFRGSIAVIEVTELINSIRNSSAGFTQIPDIQAFNTALADIAFLTAGYTNDITYISTPLFIDALHSRVDRVRKIPVDQLLELLSHNRLNDHHLLSEAVKRTPLNPADSLFWRGLEEMTELNLYDDDDLLRELAGKLEYDNGSGDPFSIGSASGTLDAMIAVRRNLYGSDEKTAGEISPQQAGNIANTVLTFLLDKTQDKATGQKNLSYHYREPRARMRSLAAHILNLSADHAAIVDDIGYQNLRPKIIRVWSRESIDQHEIQMANSVYPRGRDAQGILHLLIRAD